MKRQHERIRRYWVRVWDYSSNGFRFVNDWISIETPEHTVIEQFSEKYPFTRFRIDMENGDDFLTIFESSPPFQKPLFQ
tara:strand:+ start:261 stop:497 length:237 start_codon:yes stop_codon:yes gene_type:complete